MELNPWNVILQNFKKRVEKAKKLEEEYDALFALEGKNLILRRLELTRTQDVGNLNPTMHANPVSNSSDVEMIEGFDQGNPMLHAVVLDNILSKMNFNFLKKLRLVCHTWNDVAIPILSKNCQVKLSRGYKNSYNKFNFTNSEKVKMDQRIITLSATISSAPPKFFTCLEFDIRNFTKVTEIQPLLEKFGHNLTELKIIYGSISIRNVASTLGTWCPNLKYFVLCEVKEPEDVDPIKSLTDLKLTSFSFRLVKAQKQMVKHVISIIRASKNLQNLKGLFQSSRVATEFLIQLKQVPEISKNLTDLDIRGSIPKKLTQNISISRMLDIEFSSNLKKLTLWSFNPLKRVKINELLTKLQTTLEVLRIYGKGSHNRDGYYYIDLPIFKKLKVFENHAPQEYKVKSLDILSKMPTLETLIISDPFRYDTEDEDEVPDYDEWIENSDEFEHKHHLNLKTLYLMVTINAMKTFVTIPKMFPALETFHVRLGDGEDDRVIDPETGIPIDPSVWNFTAFVCIVQMQPRLKELLIEFSIPEWTFDMDWDGFTFPIPNLEKLTLVNGNRDFSPKHIQSDIGKSLAEGPKLRCIELVNYSMRLHEVKIFNEPFEKRKIEVKFSQ